TVGERRFRTVAAATVDSVVRLSLASAALAAICAFSATSAVPARTKGETLEASYSSKALQGRLRFAVYLPPGYSQGQARYPVIYFLHGLPASPYAYRGIGFVVRALEPANLRAIVVAPQGARDGDSDP